MKNTSSSSLGFCPASDRLSEIVWFGAGYRLRTVLKEFARVTITLEFFEVERFGSAERALEAAKNAETRFLGRTG